MTNPLGGGNDFNVRDDSVVASVGVNVPTGSADELREIGRIADALKNTLKMNARFSQDFFEYHEKLPEILEKVNSLKDDAVQKLKDQLALEKEITAQVHSRGGGGSDSYGRHSIDHASDPAYSGGTRPSQDLGRSTSARGGTNENPGGTTSPEQRIREAAERAGNAGQSMTPPAAGGPASTGSGENGAPAPHPATSQPPRPNGSGSGGTPLATTTNLAQEALNTANSTGGSQLLTRVGQMGSTIGGALSNSSSPDAASIGATISKVSPWMIGIGGALGAANAGLEEYGDMTREGNSMHGGGFAEGYSHQMSVNAMALNPFITSEQARQIVDGAMNSGFSEGQGFKSMTEFMAGNLKKMNMDVKDSVELLNLTIVEGKQNIGGLSAELKVLQQTATLGPKTSEQLQESYLDVKKMLVEGGVNPNIAGQAAVQAANIGNQEGSALFQGKVEETLTSQFMSNGGANALAAGIASKYGIKYTNPDQIAARTYDKFGDNHALEYLKSTVFDKLPKYENLSEEDAHDMRMSNFTSMVKQLAPQMSDQKIRDLFSSFEGGEDIRGNAKEKVTQATGSSQFEEEFSNIDEYGIARNDKGQTRIQSIDIDSNASGPLSWIGGEASNVEKDVRSKLYNNDLLGNVIQASGGEQGIGVYDPKSQKTYKMNWNSKEMVQKLSSGEWQMVKLNQQIADYSMVDEMLTELSPDEMKNADNKAISLGEAVANGGQISEKEVHGSFALSIDISDQAQQWAKNNNVIFGSSIINQANGTTASNGRSASEQTSDPNNSGTVIVPAIPGPAEGGN